MSGKGTCSNVTDVCCEAPANSSNAVSTTCEQCGDFVCVRCSRVLDGLRTCNNCEAENARPVRRLTRTERHQAAADAGVDTWEDFRGER